MTLSYLNGISKNEKFILDSLLLNRKFETKIIATSVVIKIKKNLHLIALTYVNNNTIFYKHIKWKLICL